MIEKTQSFLKKWFIYTLISLAIIGIDKLNGLNWLKSISGSLINPISLRLKTNIDTITKPFKAIKYAFAGVDRIANLEQRLESALVDQVKIDSLEEQNKTLLKAINAPVPNSWQLIPATIISGKERLAINLGSVSGISINDIVISSSGALVGRVEAIFPHTSWIATPKKSNEKISAKVRRKNTQGVVIGDGKLAVLENIEQDESLEVGDVVLTSGLEGKYPMELVIGQIVELTGNPADIYKSAKVSLIAFDSTVFVVNQLD